MGNDTNKTLSYEDFKEEIGDKTYTDYEEFWSDWHRITGNTDHPQSIYMRASDDGTLVGEKEHFARCERDYNFRANGRPRRRR